MAQLAPIAMGLYIGKDLRIAVANRPMAELWGRATSQVIDRKLMEAVPELKGQGFEELLHGVLRTGEAYTGTEVKAVMLREGVMHPAYFNFEYSPFRDKAQNVIGVFNVAIDVTSLVVARERVEYREQQLQIQNRDLEAVVAERTSQLAFERNRATERHDALNRTFEQAPVAITVVLGPDFRIELLNPSMAQLMGRKAKDVLGKPILDAFPELQLQGHAEVLAEVHRTGESRSLTEVTLRVQGGDRKLDRCFNYTSAPFRDAKNDVVGVTTIWVEVTDEVDYRKQIEASERQFQTLLESIPQLTWGALPDGTINYQNSRWQSFTGRDHAQHGDWHWQEIVHPDDVELMAQTWTNAIAKGEPYVIESRLLRHDGAYVSYLTRALPLFDDDGQVKYWVGTSTDINEVRLAEQERKRLADELTESNKALNLRNLDLARTNQQLTRANADLDNFVYTASHDLKAPITNIQGLHELLKVELASHPQDGIDKILEMMDRSLRRFMVTIKDISDIAQLQKTELVAEGPADLHEVAGQVIQEYMPLLQQSGGRLDVDIPIGATVFMSHNGLRRVLQNLVSNAIKYREPDRSLQLSVRLTEAAGGPLLVVKDNGLGMDLTGEHRLFSMFHRMHDHVESSGIGLHMVKKIVDAHGGQIDIGSAVGVGTEVRVYFSPVLHES